MRPTPVLLTVALLLTATASSSRAACAGPEDPPLTVDVPTLSLVLEAGRPSYAAGERALVLSRVRTAAGTKVAQADITVELTRKGKPVKKLYGRTTESGEARLAFRLPVAAGRGALDAFATARLTAVPSYDCRASLVYQYGETRAPGLLSIR